MYKAVINVYEIVIGALIFGFGLFYLGFQSKAAARFVGLVKQELLQEGELYRQYNDIDINLVSGQELYAIIMGNRDLPIIIDGRLIEPDRSDYELYFSYIKAGSYKKSYGYDVKHNIVQLIFEYAGL